MKWNWLVGGVSFGRTGGGGGGARRFRRRQTAILARPFLFLLSSPASPPLNPHHSFTYPPTLHLLPNRRRPSTPYHHNCRPYPRQNVARLCALVHTKHIRVYVICAACSLGDTESSLIIFCCCFFFYHLFFALETIS